MSGFEHLNDIGTFARQTIPFQQGDEKSLRALAMFLRNPPSQKAAAPPETVIPDEVDLEHGWLGS